MSEPQQGPPVEQDDLITLIQNLENHSATNSSTIKQYQDNIDRLSLQVTNLEQLLSTLMESKTRNETKQQELERKQQDVKSRIIELAKELATLFQQNNVGTISMEDLLSQLDTTSSSEELLAIVERLIKAESGVKATQASKQSSVDTQQITRLEQELTQLKTELSTVRLQQTEQQLQVAQLEATIQRRDTEVSQAKEQLSVANKQLEEAEKNSQVLVRRIDQAKDRLTKLVALNEQSLETQKPKFNVQTDKQVLTDYLEGNATFDLITIRNPKLQSFLRAQSVLDTTPLKNNIRDLVVADGSKRFAHGVLYAKKHSLDVTRFFLLGEEYRASMEQLARDYFPVL